MAKKPQASAATNPSEPKAPGGQVDTPTTGALRCRVNWLFQGFRKDDLVEGAEVETSEAEAAPYLGGVLTRLD